MYASFCIKMIFFLLELFPVWPDTDHCMMTLPNIKSLFFLCLCELQVCLSEHGRGRGWKPLGRIKCALRVNSYKIRHSGTFAQDCFCASERNGRETIRKLRHFSYPLLCSPSFCALWGSLDPCCCLSPSVSLDELQSNFEFLQNSNRQILKWSFTYNKIIFNSSELTLKSQSLLHRDCAISTQRKTLLYDTFVYLHWTTA